MGGVTVGLRGSGENPLSREGVLRVNALWVLRGCPVRSRPV